MSDRCKNTVCGDGLIYYRATGTFSDCPECHGIGRVFAPGDALTAREAELLFGKAVIERQDTDTCIWHVLERLKDLALCRKKPLRVAPAASAPSVTERIRDQIEALAMQGYVATGVHLGQEEALAFNEFAQDLIPGADCRTGGAIYLGMKVYYASWEKSHLAVTGVREEMPKPLRSIWEKARDWVEAHYCGQEPDAIPKVLADAFDALAAAAAVIEAMKAWQLTIPVGDGGDGPDDPEARVRAYIALQDALRAYEAAGGRR